MGSQLQAYSKVKSPSQVLLCKKVRHRSSHSCLELLQSQTEEGMRKELLALQEDKHNYETTAKESLRRVLQEKIEVVRKLSEVEVGPFEELFVPSG